MQKSILYTLLVVAVTLACGCKDKARPTAKPLPEVEVNEKALAQYQTGVTEKLTGFDRWGKQQGNQVELLNAQGKVIGYLLLAPEKYERIEGYNNYINAAVVISTIRERMVYSGSFRLSEVNLAFLCFTQISGYLCVCVCVYK